MKAKKVLVLGATFNTDNMGVSALAAGALTMVANRFPDANIFFLDYGKAPITSEITVGGKKKAVSLINLRFSWKIFLPNNVAKLIFMAIFIKLVSANLGKALIAKNRWLQAIYEADIATAVSGGDSFSDIYGLGRLFYVALPMILLIVMGKRLILLPQTLGPFEGSGAKAIAKSIMNHAETVYSRDADGVTEARALLKLTDNNPKVRFCHDMGFVVTPRKPECLELIGSDGNDAHLPKPLIGLNVSGLLLLGGYTKDNMFNLKVDYQELVDSIIKFLIEEHKATILLVPHVFGESEESDTLAVSAVYERLKAKYPGRLVCVNGWYDQNEIKYIIGCCDFFVGSRMHACIAALSQAIPAIGISYSQKFIGVFDSIGVGNLIADPRQLDIVETLSIIGKAYAERDGIRVHLQTTIPTIQAEILTLLQGIE
jgi:colanic acid/amylovoran biosynthesis protein